MVEYELVEFDQCRAKGVLADVPVRCPGQLSVAERCRARQPAEPVVHPEAHDGGNQHLPPFAFRHLGAHQMGEVAQEAAVLLEDGWIDVNLLGDVLDDTLRYLGHISKGAAGESGQSEMDSEAETVGGSTMPTDDLKITGRQRVEAAEVTFGQISGDAHERV